MVNGRNYDWEHITLNLLGETIEEVTAIKYTKKREVSFNYGKGSEPTSYGRGRSEYEGELTLRLATVHSIIKKLPAGQGLPDMPPIQAIVEYADGTNPAVTDSITHILFEEDTRDLKEGDTDFLITLPFKAGRVHYNV